MAEEKKSEEVPVEETSQLSAEKATTPTIVVYPPSDELSLSESCGEANRPEQPAGTDTVEEEIIVDKDDSESSSSKEIPYTKLCNETVAHKRARTVKKVPRHDDEASDSSSSVGEYVVTYSTRKHKKEKHLEESEKVKVPPSFLIRQTKKGDLVKQQSTSSEGSETSLGSDPTLDLDSAGDYAASESSSIDFLEENLTRGKKKVASKKPDDGNDDPEKKEETGEGSSK